MQFAPAEITNYRSQSPMSKFAEPMSRLIDELKKLPGIGTKSAQRLAFHILRSTDDDAGALAAAVRDVKAQLRLCSSATTSPMSIPACTAAARPATSAWCAWSKSRPTSRPSRRRRHFNGVYHVLHGSISPLHGVGPDQLRISNLMRRVETGEVDEVILATNPTIEGEATATYLSGQVRRAGLKVTRNRDGNSCRQRHRIRRRDHHAEGDGGAAGARVGVCVDAHAGSGRRSRGQRSSSWFSLRATSPR